MFDHNGHAKSRSALLAFLRNLVGFCLGLGVTSGLLHAVDPHLPDAVERALASQARCQVLFAGPSFVNGGVKAAFFDEESQRIGLNLRSCKLAQAALHGFELERDLELALAHHEWPKLEYVVVDVTLGDGMEFQRENWFKPRLVDWHTWSAIPWLFRQYRHRSGGWVANASELSAHAQHFAMNYLDIGRGLATLERVRLLERLSDGEELERARAGARESVDEHGSGYAGALARLTREKERVRAASQTTSDSWLRELRALLRAQGYEPIFLVAPVLYTVRPFRARTQDPVFVLDFEDPARYPELYTRDVRGHTSHLQGEGPRLYSTLLARRLLELKERHVGGRRRSP